MSNRARVHIRPLPQNEVASFDGLLVTSAERTVADLAISVLRGTAVVAADAALIALGCRVFHWRWKDLENPRSLAGRIRKLLHVAAA